MNILANAEILFPSEDLLLITIISQNWVGWTVNLSLTTSEALLEHDGISNDHWNTLLIQTQKLLAEKIPEELKGAVSVGGSGAGGDDDVEQKLRDENRECYRQIGELHHKKEVLLG